MNIIETAEGAVAGRVWWRLALGALAILVIAALLWIVIYRLFFAGHAAKEQHANDVMQAEQSNAAAEGSAKAMETVRQVHDDYRRIDIVTRRNEDAITHAEGADASAPAVAAALRSALCMRDAHHGQPECAGVQPASESIGAAESDAGRLPAEK